MDGDLKPDEAPEVSGLISISHGFALKAYRKPLPFPSHVDQPPDLPDDRNGPIVTAC
jgi:hypothetical protein